MPQAFLDEREHFDVLDTAFRAKTLDQACAVFSRYKLENHLALSCLVKPELLSHEAKLWHDCIFDGYLAVWQLSGDAEAVLLLIKSRSDSWPLTILQILLEPSFALFNRPSSRMLRTLEAKFGHVATRFSSRNYVPFYVEDHLYIPPTTPVAHYDMVTVEYFHAKLAGSSQER